VLHVLASNLDCLVMVAAAREPDFSGDLIDRFLEAAASEDIEPILCVNQTDLIEEGTERPWSHYGAAGVQIVEVCAHSGAGVERLLELLAGKVSVFCGHSGVGKTSLLRRLLGDENYGRVEKISEGTGKGRHTTSGTLLTPGPRGSHLIDTPGIMNFDSADEGD
jgi:ribosome biogenesis GTPase